MPEIKIMDERNSMVKDQIIYEGGSTIELKVQIDHLRGVFKVDGSRLEIEKKTQKCLVAFPVNHFFI